MKNFLYSIGEAIMMEIDDLLEVTYPSEIAPNALLVKMFSGKKYIITVKAAE